MKYSIQILFLFLPFMGFGQKDIVTCSLQINVQEDSTTQVWNLANSYTTDWSVALEMQPNPTSSDSWNLAQWGPLQSNPPQSTETLFFVNLALQTKSNLNQGLIMARDKVCVYLFAQRKKK